MSRRKVTLRIDSITITGGRPSRSALAAAIVAEFGRQLSLPGALDELRGAATVPRLDAGRVSPSGAGDGALGRAVARTTMGVLRR